MNLWSIVGISAPALVFALVKVLAWGGLLRTGDHKRVAVIALSVVFGVAAYAYTSIPGVQDIVLGAMSTLYNITASIIAYKVMEDRNAAPETPMPPELQGRDISP